MNRKMGSLPPSTKARWQWKLRVCDWLGRMFPISGFIVENIKARTMGKRKWDASFSPLEVGKAWFYEELRKRGILETRQGWETKGLRDVLGLKKSGSKLADKFECHNLDSWVLANALVGGHSNPDNNALIKLVPLQFHRRGLHMFQPSKGGLRRSNGGTRSLGFKRGSLIWNVKLGLCYVGGTTKGRLSLHDPNDGERLTKAAKLSETRFLTDFESPQASPL